MCNLFGNKIEMWVFSVAQHGDAQVECLVSTPSVEAAVPAATNLDFAGDTPATTVVWTGKARPNFAEDSAHYSSWAFEV